MRIPQRIHNFIFGENSREANRAFYEAQLSPEEKQINLVAGLVNPDMAKVWGVDISHWDGNVQLDVTKGFGAAFVFSKALDGTVRVKYFPENRDRARTVGMLHGPYGWLYRDANVSCKSQAQAADALLKQYPCDLPFVIDFEWTTYGGKQSNPNYTDLRIWVTEFLRLGNRKPILYSAAGFMDVYGAMPADLKAMFSAFWFAHYGVSVMKRPLGFVTWEFWQFSPEGDATLYTPNDSGKKELDLNYWNGDIAELYAFAGAAVPPSGGTMWKKATGNITIRTGPGTGYPNAVVDGLNQYVLTGDVLEIDTVTSGFAHILRTFRDGKFIVPVIVSSWAGTAYMVDTVAPEIPPTEPAPDFIVAHFPDGTEKRYVPE